MRTHRCLTLTVLLAAAGSLYALAQTDDAAMEKAIMELAQARARVQIALRECRPLMDENKSGWRATYDMMRKNVEDARNLLAQAAQREQQKAQEQRDQGFVDECNRQSRDVYDRWWAFEIKDARALDSKYRDAQRIFNEVWNVCQRMPDLERCWDNAEMPSEPLTAVHNAMAKRLKETTVQAKAVFEDLNKCSSQWEGVLKDARIYLRAQNKE